MPCFACPADTPFLHPVPAVHARGALQGIFKKEENHAPRAEPQHRPGHEHGQGAERRGPPGLEGRHQGQIRRGRFQRMGLDGCAASRCRPGCCPFSPFSLVFRDASGAACRSHARGGVFGLEHCAGHPDCVSHAVGCRVHSCPNMNLVPCLVSPSTLSLCVPGLGGQRDGRQACAGHSLCH